MTRSALAEQLENGPEERACVVFIDGDAQVSTITGRGVLVVAGDLTVLAAMPFDGLVMTTGDFSLHGTGAEVATGAVLVGGVAGVDSALGATPALRFSCGPFTARPSYILKSGSWKEPAGA